MQNNTLDDKYKKLISRLCELKNAAVAFSAGTDSTFLLKAAKDALGDNVVAITVSALSFPKRELKEAVEFCKTNNIKHITVEIDQLNIEGLDKNPKNRCYLCKKEFFKKIIELAKQNGTENVLEGSNIDDLGDYRPGQAAIKELNVLSPLKEANLTKEEIRILSKKMNLKTSSKPSFACLFTRFEYGDTITKEKLAIVDEAEQFLYDLGFFQIRVRVHKNIARIEIKENEFEKILKKELRDKITEKFKKLGFDYVTLDLCGYKTGSMNINL